MTTKSILLAIIVLGIFIGIMEKVPQRSWDWFSNTSIGNQVLNYKSGNQVLPDPLRGLIDPNIKSQLTMEGVVKYTNLQRGTNGQSTLKINAKLNAAAMAKIDDLFAQQYFEHKSPNGNTPADIIKAQGYEYIVVGENLALGNFKDDETLVQAWMDSPGHRANILNHKYQEIGVAVKKGMFEGNEVWLAVQEFGAPLSACPPANQSIKTQLDANKSLLAEYETTLNRQKSDLDSNSFASPAEYNRAVTQYNILVKKTRELSERTKELVDQYNDSVNNFNSCLESN